MGGGEHASAQGLERPRPNVVVVMTDDQTAESVRVMPNLQARVAAEGTTFTNSFATYPLCCPSRATFLTGQYAHNHGVLSNRLPAGGFEKFDGTNSLPVWLQDSGYETAHVGKYLNGYGRPDPWEVPPGWSEWYGLVDPSAYRMYGYRLNENGTLVKHGHAEVDYQTDVLADRAEEYILRRASGDAPFFLSVAPLAPHSENGLSEGAVRNPRPALRHHGYFRAEPLPRPPSFDEEDVSDKPAFVRALPPLDARTVAGIRRNYRSQLESLLAVDDMVGRIVDALEFSGELDNTVLVFTSDNGFFNGEHRLPTGKVHHYEEASRVPLIVRGPGFPAGSNRVQPVGNIDLAPTIVDLAGASAGRLMDGRSLAPLAGSDKRELDRDLLLESQSYAAIRTARFVYVEYSTGERELYDLVRDPFQLESLHADPAHAVTRQVLARELASLRGCPRNRCQGEPWLSLDFRYRRSESAAGACSRSNVLVELVGRDLESVSHVGFSFRRRDLGIDAGPPFRRRLTRVQLGKHQTFPIRAQIVLRDGRRVSRAEPVPPRC